MTPETPPLPPESRPRPLRRWLYRVVLLPFFAFAGGAAATLVAGSGAQATGRDDGPYAAVAQLGRVLVAVENDYVEPVDRTKLVNGAIKGMVAELDPHSAYMPAEDFSLFQSDTEGKFGGVGIEVDARGDALTVIAPIEGSPAERAGVRSGDRIVLVDGQDAAAQGLEKMVRRMRGDPGTHVKLTIRRQGVPQPLTFDLAREIIHVPSVAARMLEGGVAYVRIKQFQEHTHDELLAAAGRVRAEAGGHVDGVLLDMRSNPGGLVDEASEVADEFLTGGTIYTTRHRGQVIDDVRAKGGGAFASVPIVLLVNEWSASAAELVAGALQDHKRATVVGAPTFGKGSVQSIIGLPGGAGLRLTIARYYTPSGHAIQADGVHPDVVLEVSGDASFVLRERDLEGHLSGETWSPTPASDAGVQMLTSDGGTVIEGTMRSNAPNVPKDPTKSQDLVLRRGYEVLRAKMKGG